MKPSVVLLLLSCSFLHAQSIRIGQFDELKVFDGIQVTIISSETDSLVVEGVNKEHLSYKNKNGRLYLRMNLKKRLSGFNTSVALFCSRPLDVIDANEGAFVTFQDVLSQQSITLKAQEGAEINALLDVDKVTTKTTSGGVIHLKGVALIQDHRVSAGGNLEAETLDSEQVEVCVRAGGNASVRASELAEAKVALGGNVNVFGNPKKLIKKGFLGGQVDQANSKEENE